MKKFYTYIHSRNDTGAIFYVGKGMGTRAMQKTSRNRHWRNIANTHGFFVTILREFDDEAEAFAHERFLIQALRAAGVALVNATDGGEGTSGRVPAEESRAKASASYAALLADPVRGAELREKKLQMWRDPEMREKMVSGMRGKPKSAETRAKMSAARKAIWADPDGRAKSIASLTGVKKSPEACARLGELRQGRTVSPETRAKISATARAKRAAKSTGCA